MTHKKYNPTWDGYMGDVLRGNVGINQLKPQHEFFDAIGLEKVLRDFSIGYRVIESIFKDEYTLADFLGNVTMDMAKTAIIAASSWVVGSLLTATAFLGGSIIAVALIVLAVGVLAAYILDTLDKQYGISEKLIALLKEEMKRKPRTPEADLQHFFNELGRFR